jgi:hypothetical protein
MNSHIPSPGDLRPDDRMITGSDCYIDPNVEWVTDTVVP